MNGLFILRNLQTSSGKQFVDIWFFAANLTDTQFEKLYEMNDTLVVPGQSPRQLADIQKLVKGYGREYVYEATNKTGHYFDPTDQSKCILKEIFEGYLNYDNLFYSSQEDLEASAKDRKYGRHYIHG